MRTYTSTQARADISEVLDAAATANRLKSPVEMAAQRWLSARLNSRRT